MSQDQDINFFNSKLDEWLKDPAYANKFVVISGQQIKGIYDTFSDALQFATSTLSEGQYIIQRVIRASDQINFLRSAI